MLAQKAKVTFYVTPHTFRILTSKALVQKKKKLLKRELCLKVASHQWLMEKTGSGTLTKIKLFECMWDGRFIAFCYAKSAVLISVLFSLLPH